MPLPPPPGGANFDTKWVGGWSIEPDKDRETTAKDGWQCVERSWRTFSSRRGWLMISARLAYDLGEVDS